MPSTLYERELPPLPPPKKLGTVLVIGGCGFLGRSVVDQLLNFPSEKQSSQTAQTQSASLGPNKGRYEYNLEPLSTRYPPIDQAATTVHALDLRCTKNRLPGCTYHEADITDADQLRTVFKTVQPDVVINTASPQFDAPHAILRKVNIDGTKTLLDVAGNHKSWSKDGDKRCRAFVHTSSSSVIHDAQSDLKNADERWPYHVPNKNEFYSETKAVAERMVLAANGGEDVGGMLTAAVRPAGITGEGDMGGISYSICKTAAVAPGWQLNLQLGEGDNLFDTTYVGNVVLGLLLVAEGLLTTSRRVGESGVKDGGILEHERIDGEAFIVTNDQPCYFWEITRFMYSRMGREGVGARDKVWALPQDFAALIGGLSEIFGALTGRKGKINRQTVKYSCIHRYYSCEKLKRRCGYIPVVGVEEGLMRSVKWFRDWEENEAAKQGQEKKTQ
ncbi:erg26, C-3 sterol dehydrogenase [Exophiala xenobiotica]|uniref:Erg26, C-3 sterol dehydrogenase n=1 Tax=Lithohypha guttulata TaxID=1690604 RepID=A0ABR0K931_9EURO|nr:erg26, C-3 sterol dehydrogenase [Lithohypha guttulata]KAK5319336.1 erg26, C-3 sterol dehydrogenase [Exophiala xenobiotica]